MGLRQSGRRDGEGRREEGKRGRRKEEEKEDLVVFSFTIDFTFSVFVNQYLRDAGEFRS